MELTLRGLFTPLITPFTASGDVAADALEALAHTVLDAGAAGLVALGTTAEASTLTAAERRAVLDTCARVARARGVPLIAGAGSNDTAGSAAALRGLAEWPEIAAALVIVPYYTRPSEDGVVAHFTRLADESPVPLIVYNIPYRTSRILSGQTLLRLAAVPGIAGMKHAPGGIDAGTLTLMTSVPDRFAILGGDDAFVSPLLALGAAGGILACSHVRTADFAALIGAWHSGDVTRARALTRTVIPLAQALMAEPNPAVIKGVLHAQGVIPSPAVRLPLLPAGRARVDAALALAAG
ncbi:MAG: 4-hydroxy-tetrahydrodipicolinate synthase [Streptosporangiales bacterium]|nr:4-hydroxy-tetrahydrodipicolinate synthase [Streptosporangiales bacterium]